jgi:hypothetical protein
MASDNPLWGTERIRGELLKLGLVVSARSIRRYRRPWTSRPPSVAWRTFLRNELAGIWAADLLVVQTLTFKTLYVLFFIQHQRRRLVHLNVTTQPTVAWVWQQLLNATPDGRQPRHLINDRDGVYGADLDARLKGTFRRERPERVRRLLQSRSATSKPGLGHARSQGSLQVRCPPTPVE